MKKGLPIAKEGYPFIGIVLSVTLLSWAVGWTRLAAILFLLTVFVISFFRDPERRIQAAKEDVMSPADGRVIIVEEVKDPRGLSGVWQKVTIFMSVFNAHVNRIPLSGKIKEIRYHPGRFLMGFSEKASLENEQNAIKLEGNNGKEIMFVQIAGLIARRIICHLEEGSEVHVGDRFGLIRFGSRVDMYLPREAEVLVVPGDRVKAGLHKIARFNEQSE